MENALIQEAQQLVNTMRLAAAKEKLGQALEGNPRSVEALTGLARIALVTGDKTQASSLIRRALTVSPRDLDALTLKAAQLIDEQQHLQALALLTEASSAGATSHALLYNLAVCHKELGDLDQARDACEQALALRDDFETRYELGNILALDDDVEGAILEVLRSVEKNPAFVKGYLTLGSLFADAGDGEGAIRIYQEALRNVEGAPVLREKLCDLLALKLDFVHALEHAQVLARERGALQDHLRVAEYLLGLGCIPDAVAANQEAARTDPRAWQPHFNLGELYASVGAFSDAERSYCDAVERAGPDVWQPHNGLGLLLLHHGSDPQEAGRWFIAAAEKGPDRPEPVYNLALAQVALGKPDDALKLVEKALARIPQDSLLYADATRLRDALGASPRRKRS